MTAQRTAITLGVAAIATLSISSCGNKLTTDVAVSAPTTAVTETLAPGVVHAAFPTGTASGIDIIDVDLQSAAYRPAILTEGLKVEKGRLMGASYTPYDWLDRSHALAAMNGAYFGTGTDSRKELIGLVVSKGRVIQHAPPLHGKAGTYVRSAFGINSAGQPQIVWGATASKGGPWVYAYSQPTDPHGGYRWNAAEAVGCGPTLIRSGRKVVTDHEERLVNDISTARTFVAYDVSVGKPVHFVMGIGSRLTYAELADQVASYFQRVHGTKVHRAMCLDGGASTQLSYMQNGAIQSPRSTTVTVPDAIALVHK
ncbi:MAG TPA: phosphodiester glycosidase family protein [Capsulimonadaceae bacterium]